MAEAALILKPAAGDGLCDPECWVCGSLRMQLRKPSDIVNEELSSESFAITDSDYGKTGALFQCNDCGFLQCPHMQDVLKFYEALEDDAYEAGRAERALQSRQLLGLLGRERPVGRLLDIGAGSGILVEEALALGYEAVGVEPSRWLQRHAIERDLPVHLGIFPKEGLNPGLDVITLVDVIEHVPNPVELLIHIREHLADNGIGLVVTPDVSSVAARLLRRRWWHFRVAHIGYFNKRTLIKALDGAGLVPIRIGRPGWYFTVEYLRHRVNRYLPRMLRCRIPQWFGKVVVPLNLRDSLFVIFKKAQRND